MTFPCGQGLSLLAQGDTTNKTWDLVILGGIVVDGTGLSRRRADIGIKNGRIAALGHVPNAKDAESVIDALLFSGQRLDGFGQFWGVPLDGMRRAEFLRVFEF